MQAASHSAPPGYIHWASVDYQGQHLVAYNHDRYIAVHARPRLALSEAVSRDQLPYHVQLAIEAFDPAGQLGPGQPAGSARLRESITRTRPPGAL